MKPKKKTSKNQEPICLSVNSKEEFNSLKFKVGLSDHENFYPVAAEELPVPLRLRHENRWWVRCVSDEIIPYHICHESFVDTNALYKKEHPCWNCSLGKVYRELNVDDSFKVERFETFNTL